MYPFFIFLWVSFFVLIIYFLVKDFLYSQSFFLKKSNFSFPERINAFYYGLLVHSFVSKEDYYALLFLFMKKKNIPYFKLKEEQVSMDIWNDFSFRILKKARRDGLIRNNVRCTKLTFLSLFFLFLIFFPLFVNQISSLSSFLIFLSFLFLSPFFVKCLKRKKILSEKGVKTRYLLYGYFLYFRVVEYDRFTSLSYEQKIHDKKIPFLIASSLLCFPELKKKKRNSFFQKIFSFFLPRKNIILRFPSRYKSQEQFFEEFFSFLEAF